MPLNLAQVHMGTLNMRDGQRGKMHHLAQCLQNHHIDVALLTETKLQSQFDQQIGTYQFIHTEAHSNHSGRVSLA
jgi:exonuclease III